MTEWLLIDHTQQKAQTLVYIPISEVLKRLRLSESFNHPEIATAISLFVREVVLKVKGYTQKDVALQHVCLNLVEDHTLNQLKAGGADQ